MTELLRKTTTTQLSYVLWGTQKPADLIKVIELFPEDARIHIDVDNDFNTPRIELSTTIVLS
jgi:hypothetical protein